MKQFEALNAMRGLAAILAVLFHSDEFLRVNMAPGGYLAVDLFFVLSGFVIAHAYEERLKAGLMWREFALARLIRFFPMLFLAVCIGLARALAGIITHSPSALSVPELVIAAGTSFFLLPAPITTSGDLFVLNVPLWTLCFELLVNLVYALAVNKLDTIKLILIAVLAGGVMAAYLLQSGNNDNGALLNTALGGVARAFFGFSIGVLIHRLRLRISVPPSLLLFSVTAALCAPVPQELRPLFDLIFAILVAPVMVIAGSSIDQSGWQLKVSMWLGALSFPLYAVHRPLIGMAETITNRLDIDVPLINYAFIFALICFSVFLNYSYDEPFRRYLKSRLLMRPTTILSRSTV